MWPVKEPCPRPIKSVGPRHCFVVVVINRRDTGKKVSLWVVSFSFVYLELPRWFRWVTRAENHWHQNPFVVEKGTQKPREGKWPQTQATWLLTQSFPHHPDSCPFSLPSKSDQSPSSALRRAYIDSCNVAVLLNNAPVIWNIRNSFMTHKEGSD